jgi:hypothetical protein
VTLTAPIPELAPVTKTVLPNKRDALKTMLNDGGVCVKREPRIREDAVTWSRLPKGLHVHVRKPGRVQHRDQDRVEASLHLRVDIQVIINVDHG